LTKAQPGLQIISAYLAHAQKYVNDNMPFVLKQAQQLLELCLHFVSAAFTTISNYFHQAINAIETQFGWTEGEIQRIFLHGVKSFLDMLNGLFQWLNSKL